MIAQANHAPPPVVFNREDAAKAFPGYPRIGEGKNKYVFLGLTVHGDRDNLDAAKAKLADKGWRSAYVTVPSGEEVLSVVGMGRSADDIRLLNQHFSDGEFGPVRSEPYIIPDPSNFF